MNSSDSGKLNRFGFIDTENDGRIKLGTISGYYRKEFTSGAIFKTDAFAGLTFKFGAKN